MGNRCPDCGKFVGLTDPDSPEVLDTSVDGDTVTVEVRLVRECQDCGTEMKETTLTVTVDLDHDCVELRAHPELAEVDAEQWDVDDPDVEPTSRTTGKGRGTRTYYGAAVTVTARCRFCGQEVTGVGSEEEQASAFEELA